MKTIEEAAKEYSLNSNSNFVGDGENEFKAGIAFAQRWIPVEEELPEYILNIIDEKYVDEVICKGNYSNGTYGHMLLKRMKNTNSGWNWDCGPAFTPTHWRQIELK